METSYRIEDNKLIITTVETKETVISLDDITFQRDTLSGEISRYEAILTSAEEAKAKLEEQLATYQKYTDVIKREKSLEEVGFINKK